VPWNTLIAVICALVLACPVIANESGTGILEQGSDRSTECMLGMAGRALAWLWGIQSSAEGPEGASGCLGIHVWSDSLGDVRASPLRQSTMCESETFIPRDPTRQHQRPSWQGPLSWGSWGTAPQGEAIGSRCSVDSATLSDMLSERDQSGIRSVESDDSLTDTRTNVDERRANQCRFQHLDPGRWTAREEDRTARCVLKRWPVEGGLAKFRAVGDCESGWWRKAYNPSGPYVGLFQHALSSWPYRVAAYRPTWWSLRPGWRNSRSQIVVTARMVREVGWGPWTCA